MERDLTNLLSKYKGCSVFASQCIKNKHFNICCFYTYFNEIARSSKFLRLILFTITAAQPLRIALTLRYCCEDVEATLQHSA